MGHILYELLNTIHCLIYKLPTPLTFQQLTVILKRILCCSLAMPWANRFTVSQPVTKWKTGNTEQKRASSFILWTDTYLYLESFFATVMYHTFLHTGLMDI